MKIITIEKKQLSPRTLNLKQDLWCKAYATDVRCLGNGSEAYKLVYGLKEAPISHDVAKASATRFLTDPRFTARINEYLEVDGFNNETVDAHHLFLIRQKKDLNVSMKGIEHYNRLKKRVDNKVELILPKPLMELEDDEVIHKIEKGKARDVSNEQDMIIDNTEYGST